MADTGTRCRWARGTRTARSRCCSWTAPRQMWTLLTCGVGLKLSVPVLLSPRRGAAPPFLFFGQIGRGEFSIYHRGFIYHKGLEKERTGRARERREARGRLWQWLNFLLRLGSTARQ